MNRTEEEIKKWNASSTTWCMNCVHYTEKKPLDKCPRDGWCDLPMTINGVKSKKPFHPTDKNSGQFCKEFVDRDTGLTGFEIHTKLPERSRGPLEVQHLSKYITWKEVGHI